MKKILYILLFFISLSACAEEPSLFGTKLEVTNNCQIKATRGGTKEKIIKLTLPKSKQCKFIMYDETNLIHMEPIANFYMLLVESTTETKDGCLSEHTAVIVKRNGNVVAANFNKKSLTCNIDRETKLFHHFAYEMKLIK